MSKNTKKGPLNNQNSNYLTQDKRGEEVIKNNISLIAIEKWLSKNSQIVKEIENGDKKWISNIRFENI